MSYDNPFSTRPKTVVLLGLGPSNKEWVSECTRKKKLMRADEVWGINTAHRIFKTDRIWAMDDLAHIEHEYPEWAAELKLSKTPIITCRAHPDYPNAWAFPLEEVKKALDDDFFSNSVAYAVAYAVYLQVETLYLFGTDFWYPNAAVTESGIGCVSYWLGIAKERGVHYRIPNTSTLLDGNLVVADEKTGQAKRLLYGYDYNPQIAKRNIQRGRGDPLQEAIATRAYRPTDPNDPDCMQVIEEKMGKDALERGDVEIVPK